MKFILFATLLSKNQDSKNNTKQKIIYILILPLRLQYLLEKAAGRQALISILVLQVYGL